MDNAGKIASCNACLLSERMKDCQSCPLNPGMLKLSPSERDTVSRVELLVKPVKETLKP